MKNGVVLSFLLLFATFHPALALDVPMTHDVQTANVISEYPVDLDAGTTVTFRTTNFAAGADPVLHLLDAQGREVAVNDNGGPGLAAQLRYTPSSGGNYRVVVRSRTADRAGTCDLTRNSVPWQSGVAFGGWQTPLPQLRAGESLDTVKLPNGAKGAHILFVLRADGIGIEHRGYGNGTTGGAYVSLPAALGDRLVVVGVNRPGTAGAVRLVRNDAAIAGHDPDHDGLGSELEKSIGTCSTLTGISGNFECNQVTDARDTDGDGISDGWEVLGRRNVSPHQPLPLWGADPRHKDLFVEFDFMQRSPGEADVRMTPSNARKFAAYYGDRIGVPSDLRLLYHAAILRNPDHEPGIRVHLDIGVDATSPEDATTFGDWGGHNVIPPVQNAEGNWVGARYQDAWRDHLIPARRGIFRHSSSPAGGGGGSNTENHIAFSSGVNAPWGLAHESGHAQGIGHSGPSQVTGVVDVNCKPNYPSMMNYAYQNLPNEIGFGDGLTAPALNNAALKEWRAVAAGDTTYLQTLKSVYRYHIDPEAGHVDWNRDGTFAPAGTTVRAYANYSPTSAGGCEFTRYNRMYATTEETAASPAIARYHGRTYVFWATQNSIAYRWTSSALNCPVPDTQPCAGWNGGGTIPIAGARGIDAAPIRFGAAARLVVVAVTPAGLMQTRLAVSPFTETWTVPTTISAESVTGEPSLGAMSDCSLTLAYKAGNGTLRTRRMNCASWNWSAATTALDASGTSITLPAQASPAIARGYLPTQGASPLLLGAFAGSSGMLRLYARDTATGRWLLSSDLESNGVAVAGRPAMAWVPTGAASHPGRLYLVYRQPAEGAFRWMWSYVKVTTDAAGNQTSRGVIGLDSWFDNKWFAGTGHDLLYEPGIDTNLRSVHATAGGVLLNPKADGIQDFAYRNYDDWQVHRVSICRQVVNPDGLITDPIRCPENDW